MVNNNKMYRISQNYIVTWYQGGMYISNPTDLHNRQKKKIGREDLEILIHFIEPNDPAIVENLFSPPLKSEVKRFIADIIDRKILVEHDQVTDMHKNISQMLETMRTISENKQAALAEGRPHNLLMAKKMYKDQKLIEILKGRRGLEIGGDVPGISDKLSKNAALITLDYDENKKADMHFDATDLAVFKNDEFDFIISSHTLEHLTNPIRALKEWKRVIRDGGYIYLIVPNKEFTSDHNRPLTTLQHLLEDFEKGVGLSDLTHVPEILNNADWWDMHNFIPLEAPHLHLHVWNMNTLVTLLEYAGLDILDRWESPTCNLHVLTMKTENGKLFRAAKTAWVKERHRSNWKPLFRGTRGYIKWLVVDIAKNFVKILPYFMYVRIRDYFRDRRKGQRTQGG